MPTKRTLKPPAPPNQVRRDLGLPASAPFVGYGVHLPERDEFLALESQGEYVDKWGWTIFPNYGLHYHRYDKAVRTARRYGKGAIVVYMFDVGDRYIVGGVD